jgi:hypothetical protein
MTNALMLFCWSWKILLLRSLHSVHATAVHASCLSLWQVAVHVSGAVVCEGNMVLLKTQFVSAVAIVQDVNR